MFTFLAAAAVFAGRSIAFSMLDGEERSDPDVNRFAHLSKEADIDSAPRSKTVIGTFTLADYDEADAAYVSAFVSKDAVA